MTKASAARPSLVEDITTALSLEIMEGRYDSDKRLPTEPQLSAKFGVSRTVVREATKQLISRGLVEVERGLGVRIVNDLHKPLSRSLELRMPDARDRLEKLMEARGLVEPAVARMAALRATPADLRQLRKVHTSMCEAKDADTASELDLEFHRLLTRTAGNEIYELMLESVADLGRESRRATNTETRWQYAISGHEAILAAIEQGDADGAERAMAKHMELAAENLQHYFTKRPKRT